MTPVLSTLILDTDLLLCFLFFFREAMTSDKLKVMIRKHRIFPLLIFLWLYNTFISLTFGEYIFSKSTISERLSPGCEHNCWSLPVQESRIQNDEEILRLCSSSPDINKANWGECKRKCVRPKCLRVGPDQTCQSQDQFIQSCPNECCPGGCDEVSWSSWSTCSKVCVESSCIENGPNNNHVDSKLFSSFTALRNCPDRSFCQGAASVSNVTDWSSVTSPKVAQGKIRCHVTCVKRRFLKHKNSETKLVDMAECECQKNNLDAKQKQRKNLRKNKKLILRFLNRLNQDEEIKPNLITPADVILSNF